VVRKKDPNLAAGPLTDEKPEGPDTNWRERDLAVATSEREFAEQLLAAAKQSEKKARALWIVLRARRSYEGARKEYRPGQNDFRRAADSDPDLEMLLAASDHLRGAEWLVATTRAEFVTAFEKHLERVKEIEALVKATPESDREIAAVSRFVPGAGADPGVPAKRRKEMDQALVAMHGEEAEQLLDAAKQSDQRAHALLRVLAARRHYRHLKKYHDEGRITPDKLIQAAIQVLEAEHMAADNESQRRHVLEGIVDLTREVEAREQAELLVGRGTEADVAAATLNRIEAEIRLRESTSPRDTPDLGALERRLRELERKLDQRANERPAR
jgi:hypothetical protein